MKIEILPVKQYEKELLICDKASAYAKRIMKRNRSNSMSAEQAQHPDYRDCGNAMRGRVQQYQIITDPPESFGAYINDAGHAVTWMGDLLSGKPGLISSTWKVRNSHIGTEMSQYYFVIGGYEYTGRGFGVGMCINLKMTPKSKRIVQADL